MVSGFIGMFYLVTYLYRVGTILAQFSWGRQAEKPPPEVFEHVALLATEPRMEYFWDEWF
jgi:hypothetical protein